MISNFEPKFLNDIISRSIWYSIIPNSEKPLFRKAKYKSLEVENINGAENSDNSDLFVIRIGYGTDPKKLVSKGAVFKNENDITLAIKDSFGSEWCEIFQFYKDKEKVHLIDELQCLNAFSVKDGNISRKPMRFKGRIKPIQNISDTSIETLANVITNDDGQDWIEVDVQNSPMEMNDSVQMQK